MRKIQRKQCQLKYSSFFSREMECKIWREFIKILSFRKDLISIIKPFIEKLKNNNNNEQYNIHDKNYFCFLKSLPIYYIDLLHSYEIIDDKKYLILMPKKAFSSTFQTLNSVKEIIEEDNREK